jgi:hypothetical protein
MAGDAEEGGDRRDDDDRRPERRMPEGAHQTSRCPLLLI